MRVGVFLKLVGEGGRTKRVDEVVALAVRAEQLGYDSVWVMDHLFTERTGTRVPVHDPLQLLAAIAARTARVELGALVLCGPFRLSVQLARESATLAEASGGRYICGLGAGWNRPEFDAIGMPFDRLVSRLEQQVDDYRRLLAEPGLMPAGERPPLWLGAAKPRMLRLAARVADGWNLAWEGDDPTRWIETAEALRGHLRDAGRAEAAFVFSAGVMAVVAEGQELEKHRERSGGMRFAGGSAGAVAASLRRYADAGCDHAILQLSSALGVDNDEAMLEPAAEVVPLVR